MPVLGALICVRSGGDGIPSPTDCARPRRCRAGPWRHRTNAALRPHIQVSRLDGLLRILYRSVQDGPGSESSVNVYTEENLGVLVAVADHLQDEVSEELHAAWPVCAQHGFGAHAQVRQGSAVWWCRHSEHTVAQIGSLTRPERVP